MTNLNVTLNIDDILPEKISDESAYHLVNFFINLTAELESQYFAQIRRYINDNISTNGDIIQNQFDDEIPF